MPSSLKMNREEMTRFLAKEFPQSTSQVVEIAEDYSLLKQVIDSSHLRPGGTVSGPTLMTLADVAMYVVLLSKIGPVALAVTTDLTIHFLNKPEADQPIMAKAKLLKLGKRLAIAEVEMYSQGSNQLVAHVVGTYSVPPDAQA